MKRRCDENIVHDKFQVFSLPKTFPDQAFSKKKTAKIVYQVILWFGFDCSSHVSGLLKILSKAINTKQVRIASDCAQVASDLVIVTEL